MKKSKPHYTMIPQEDGGILVYKEHGDILSREQVKELMEEAVTTFDQEGILEEIDEANEENALYKLGFQLEELDRYHRYGVPIINQHKRDIHKKVSSCNHCGEEITGEYYYRLKHVYEEFSNHYCSEPCAQKAWDEWFKALLKEHNLYNERVLNWAGFETTTC